MGIIKRNRWGPKLRKLLRDLQFSNLDADTKVCVEDEIFYFNNTRFFAIAWAVIIVESINIINVLCFSASGLSTVNNIQYFIMYVVLLSSAAACLTLRHICSDKTELLQQYYIFFTFFWAIWNSVLSAMDLRRNPNISVFTAGIFALALLVRLKPIQIFLIVAGSIATFLISAILMGSYYLSNGIVINLIMIGTMALLISCSRYFSTLEGLDYRQKLIMQTNRRTEEKHRLAIVYEQQNALLKHSSELLFVWDKKTNMITMSKKDAICPADKEKLCDCLVKCMDKEEITLLLSNNCKVECTMFYSDGNITEGAAGRITFI